eukprot:gb/GECG01002468.1/.p1 GENE.gb/GECG01002468.1/~~gb/GECG01002468.1/.p1  ORF type:complete len:206 (+),score=8.30 gb/GECG01002468.1/:1-618(+)
MEKRNPGSRLLHSLRESVDHIPPTNAKSVRNSIHCSAHGFQLLHGEWVRVPQIGFDALPTIIPPMFLCRYLQSSWFIQTTPVQPTNMIQYVVGLCLFIGGWAINLHADSVLRNLRTRHNPDYHPKTRYYIPKGGLFEYVSGANFFGEILEWFGFALAAHTLPAWAFAIFAFSNIAPRGWQHHQWYLNKFKEEYPSSRYAVIPFVW